MRNDRGSYTKNKQPKLKIGRYILWLIVFIFIFKLFFAKFDVDQKIVIQKWDTFQTFIQDFSSIEKLGLKIYMVSHKNSLDLSAIQEGTYTFEWKYSKSDFLAVINDGPKQSFDKYVVLEWRSIYDIDADLVKKWLISEWDYISFVNSSDIISKYVSRYDFLSKANVSKSLKSLEWFLYPDTYHLDVWATNLIDQLVYLQLENFKTKVRDKYENKISSFGKLSWYDVVVLASVVEKEERNTKNKPTVAGIFINRLANGMRLDADITLCYGLHEAYETCTPSMIARKIYDKTNIYNTRQVGWMPPQAISNPAVDSIDAVLNFVDSDYVYYLHDPKWWIHYGRTVAEHNANKRKYLD